MRGWVMGANTELPRDVSIVWARPVPLHFHARYSAEARTYRYIILNRGSRSGLALKRATCIYKPLDHERMADAAVHLCGHYDFSAFRSSECQSNSPIRRVERLTVHRQGEWVVIEVTANAFLHHMMRNIVGLLIEIGRRIGVRQIREEEESASKGLGAIEGAIFGLLGLILAFSFSGALTRFDARRHLVVEEANDIGTAWLRTLTQKPTNLF